MKFNKAALFSSLGLSIIHFVIVIILMKFPPDFLSSGLAHKIQSVLMQPGVWFADFMGCIKDRPMWWVVLLLNSALWGNILAFAIRTFFSGKHGNSSD